MKENKKITTGWQVPFKVKDIFVSFCTEVGSLVQEDCAGALTVWCHLPGQIREWAKLEAKGKSSAIRVEFWKIFAAHTINAVQAEYAKQVKDIEEGVVPPKMTPEETEVFKEIARLLPKLISFTPVQRRKVLEGFHLVVSGAIAIPDKLHKRKTRRKSAEP